MILALSGFGRNREIEADSAGRNVEIRRENYFSSNLEFSGDARRDCLQITQYERFLLDIRHEPLFLGVSLVAAVFRYDLHHLRV